MRALFFAGLLLGSTACGVSSALRSSGDYRSLESYGAARWGMTRDELESAVSDLTPCGASGLCRDEELKGRPAHVRYEVLRGHLARVELEIASSSPAADFSGLERDLTEAYGSPRHPRATPPRRNPGREVMEDLADLARVFSLSSGVRSLVLGAAPPAHFNAEVRWTTRESALELRGSDQALHLRLSSRALLPAG
jgi:hypothetical protein